MWWSLGQHEATRQWTAEASSWILPRCSRSDAAFFSASRVRLMSSAGPSWASGVEQVAPGGYAEVVDQSAGSVAEQGDGFHAEKW